MHGSEVSNFCVIIPHFLITMLLIHFMVLALALAAPLEVVMPKNLTAPSRCTRSEDWQAYAFLVEDCYTAIQRLYIEEVLKKPDAIYEFITTGTYPQTLHPWMRTPIEYTVSEYHPVPAICAVVAGGGDLQHDLEKRKQSPWLIKRKSRLVYTLHRYAQLVRTQKRVIAWTWRCELSILGHG